MFRQLFLILPYNYFSCPITCYMLHVALVTRCYVVTFTRLFSSGNYNIITISLQYHYNLFSPSTIQYLHINSKTTSRLYKPLYFTLVYKTTLPTITSPLKAIIQYYNSWIIVQLFNYKFVIFFTNHFTQQPQSGWNPVIVRVLVSLIYFML